METSSTRSTDQATTNKHATKVRLYRRLLRVLKRCAWGFLLLLTLYAIILLAGLIPVNNRFKPATGGITIAIVSNAVHAELVLPIRTDLVDWREHFQLWRHMLTVAVKSIVE